MRLVIGAILACSILAAPIHGTAARAASIIAPGEEYAQAEQALMGGRVEVGLKGLEHAANLKLLRAQVRLAKIYREGRLVLRDDLKACQLFSEAANVHSKIDPKHPTASMVGEAYRYWAQCYVRGLAQPGWNQNLGVAAELFFQAGVIFGDVPALYELSQMYLSGQGIAQNVKLAVDHLYATSRKRYPPALARLGHMMWEGRLVKRRAGPGLALLILAKEGAAPEDRTWIVSLYDDAMITATETEEAEAQKVAAEWRATYGPPQPNMAPADPNGKTEMMPIPQRAPGRAIVPMAGEQQRNSFSSQPTGASSAPPEP